MHSVLTEGALPRRIVSVLTAPIMPSFVTRMVSFAPVPLQGLRLARQLRQRACLRGLRADQRKGE